MAYANVRVLVQNAVTWAMMGRMARLESAEELFKGRHFDQEIVLLCVRWYLSYKLSYRDLVAMMAERGIELAHTTILRWVQHFIKEVILGPWDIGVAAALDNLAGVIDSQGRHNRAEPFYKRAHEIRGIHPHLGTRPEALLKPSDWGGFTAAP